MVIGLRVMVFPFFTFLSKFSAVHVPSVVWGEAFFMKTSRFWYGPPLSGQFTPINVH